MVAKGGARDGPPSAPWQLRQRCGTCWPADPETPDGLTALRASPLAVLSGSGSAPQAATTMSSERMAARRSEQRKPVTILPSDRTPARLVDWAALGTVQKRSRAPVCDHNTRHPARKRG